ncbi:HAD family hydrolase [Planctomycetota bacterium]
MLFDLDGTLLDTLKDLADSMNTVLSQHGLNAYPVKNYRHFIGRGLEQLVRSVLPKDNINDKIVEEYLSAMKLEYAKRWADSTNPYPGIPDLLNELTKLDLPMVVLSNKSDNFTQIMVKTLLPGGQFIIVHGHKDTVAAKPDPASALDIADELKIQPKDFLYLGDTSIDMQTAEAAGMYAVGVLWGFHTDEELKANGAKVLVESPLQVLELLKH